MTTKKHMELQSILLKFVPKNNHDVKLGLIEKNDGEKNLHLHFLIVLQPIPLVVP